MNHSKIWNNFLSSWYLIGLSRPFSLGVSHKVARAESFEILTGWIYKMASSLYLIFQLEWLKHLDSKMSLPTLSCHVALYLIVSCQVWQSVTWYSNWILADGAVQRPQWKLQVFFRPDLRIMHCHFYYILLVKNSNKSSPLP